MSTYRRDSWFSRMRRKFKNRNFRRAFERHSCCITSAIMLAPRMSCLNGRLLDISQGGGMFRPALSYLMNRRGAEGFLVVAEQKIPFHIVHTVASGYALQFDTLLTEEQLEFILSFDINKMAQKAA